MNYSKYIQIAFDNLKNSYSPYSNFKVSACLLAKSGKVYTGNNIENATYGATICAERTAITKAVSEGDKEFELIVIVCSGEDFAYPCGICRQVMVEFSPDMKVIVAKSQEDYRVHTASELLPHFFSLKSEGEK
ncbi:MAG: cytidine deaminase [Clostridia bacterium]|nr:cytidine deaminase [Clostridia bacterium]